MIDYQFVAHVMDKLPTRLMKHSVLFWKAYNLASRRSVEKALLPKAEEYAVKFVAEWASHYGEETATRKVHNVLHMVSRVRLYGPMHCHSMYPFEHLNKVCIYISASSES
jgi:hypothetical protein